MKANILRMLIVFLALSAITSCTHRLVGVWNVAKFETQTPNEAASSLQNIGTIKFKKNGEGENNLNYLVLGVNQIDQSPFHWTWVDDKYVTISGDSSQFSKTWIIVKNKKKEQKWETTDGSNTVISLELTKE